MTKQACKRSILLLALTVTTCLNSFGQLSTAFSASHVSGCAPIVVQFSDQSTGNPSQWRWELGNGVVSYLQNPSTTYFNPGTYSVKLVIKNAAGADSLKKTSYITVYPTPAVAFKASDTSGCYPFQVQFTDETIPAAAGITSWQWDFGDGSVSNLQHPSHVYTAAGNYTVTLKVTNTNGCVKTLSKTAYIKTTFGVETGFTVDKNFFCKAPATFNFTNTTTGPGTMSYFWDFGDGKQSTVASPSHTYLANGSYSVKLIAVSPQGCRDTLMKTELISVGTLPSFAAPASICQKSSFSLTNTSQPAPVSMKWFFGDGTSSTDAQPVKVYNNPGVYFIKLVNDYGDCKDSVIRQINVFAKPNINIDVSGNNFCKVPSTVNFFGAAPGIVSYQWNFGDGSTSTAPNPSHTYTSFGGFNITLITTNSNGCRDTFSRPGFITVKKPELTIDSLPRTGCNPLTIQPRPRININDPIVSYQWNFGNGATSTQQYPTYTYTKAGNYDVTLSVVTASGCTATITMPRAVRVGDKPKAGFTVQPPIVCVDQAVNFTDTSTGLVDQWLWSFGGGESSTVQNPSWWFGPGYPSVMLTVWSNTCPDSIRIDSVAFVKPPYSNFGVTSSCTQKYTKAFSDSSYAAQSYFWKFGDGTTSTVSNPVHTYAAPGIYLVEFTVFNDSCQHTSRKTIAVIDEKANFDLPDEVCKGTIVTISSVGINATNIASWTWDFGDGNFSYQANAATHVYNQPGTYIVTLEIVDVLGCKESKTDTIKVYGPTVGFYSNTLVSCFTGNSISFTDTSSTDGIHPIVKWTWNYGDSVTEAVTAGPFQHSYANPGNYNVSLQVTDAFGCTDNFFNPVGITISKPVAAFATPDTLSCTDKPIAFINQSTGTGLKYTWTFGDGTGSADEHPVHQYNGIGSYNVGLKVEDTYGCTDSVKKAQYVKIDFPKAAFTMPDSVGTCPPMLVAFTNRSTHYTSLHWDFGDGNTSTLENPSHYFTVSGVYFVKLVVTSPGGCKDSIIRKIVLKGPRGTFDYSPQVGCKPLALTLTATSYDRENIIWDFSDGTTLSGKDSVVTHVYTNPGEYVPKMILVDAAGCSVPVVGKDTIKVTGVIAAYDINGMTFCDSGLVNFQNTSVSNDLITGWRWEFGDSLESTDQSPSHFYGEPGKYYTKLFVQTASGCVDSTAAVEINIRQSPEISITGDLSGCAPSVLQFGGSTSFTDSLSWQWSLGNGATSTSQHPPAQTYAAGTYIVTAVATDAYGCFDTSNRQVIVHALPVVNAGADLLVCEGVSAQLTATGALSYVWNNETSLSCTTCPNPTASPSGTTVYTVQGFNAAGCSDLDSVKINVRHPFVLAVGPDNSICIGEIAQLSASGADKYSWSPSTGLDRADIASPRAKPGSTTTYQLTASDNDNCFTKTASVVVTVNPLPAVNAGPDFTLPVGSSLPIKATASADVTSWNWTPPYNLSCSTCPQPDAKPRNTSTYKVDVTTAAGCTSSDEVTINVICNNGNIFIPNTFSPNNDGMNDRFFPRGTGIARIKSLRIYNRWGEVVYERINFNANDAAAGWDGTYKGKKLAPDVFIYTCDVVCENSVVLPFKGDVTLIQ